MDSGFFDNSELLTRKKELLRIFIGVLIFIALASQGNNDPSPMNLIWPWDGLSNWLGLPGALFAGAHLNLLGWSSFLIPLLLIFFVKRTKHQLLYSSLQNCLLVFLLNMVAALILSAESPYLSSATGLWGVITHYSLMDTPGRWLSLALTILLAITMGHSYRFNRLLPRTILQLILLVNYFMLGFLAGALLYLKQILSVMGSLSKNSWDNVNLLKYQLFDKQKVHKASPQDSANNLKSMDKALNVIKKTKTKTSNITSTLEETFSKAMKKAPKNDKAQNQRDLIKDALNEYEKKETNNNFKE